MSAGPDRTTGGGWASPGASPAQPADSPAPAATPAAPPAPPAASPPQPQPAWQGQAGWGGTAPSQQAPQQAPQQGGWGQQAPQQAPEAVPAQGGWGQQAPQQDGWGGAPAARVAKPGVVPLRPLGLGELLDGAVALVRRYPRPVLTVSAAIAAVSTVLQAVFLLGALQPLLEVDPVALAAGDADELAGILAGAGAAGLVTVVFTVLSGAVMTGILTVVASRGVLGRPLTLSELWQAVRPRLVRVCLAALLVTVCVFGSFVLLAALGGGAIGLLGALLDGPGIALGVLLLLALLPLAVVVYVRLAFVPCVVVLEDTRVLAGLRRSWRLVKGGTWRVLGVLLLAAVVGSVVAQVLQFPLALFGGGGAFSLDAAEGLSSTTLLLSAVGAGLAGMVVAPFTAGVTALLYVDRRMRAEGLDVALQAAAVDSR